MANCSFSPTFFFHYSNQSHIKPSGQKYVRFRAQHSSSVKPQAKQLLAIPNLVEDVSRMINKTSVKLLDAFVDLAFEFVDQPVLPSQSNFVPVQEIGGKVIVVSIEGKIPDYFPEGVYIRNGINPLFGALKSAKSMFGTSSEIWVEGEGMLHALYFCKASNGTWKAYYNNRYVESETFKLEKERNKPAFIPAAEGDSLAVLSALYLNLLRFGVGNKYLSNTNIFEHSGKHYAISENHMPQEVDISTLETLGNWELTGIWNRPFTSHPKKAPGSGELVITGVDARKPYFVVGVISADGQKIIHKVDMKFDRCIFGHEMGVTQKYNVIMDFPLTIDINRLIKGGSLITFEKDQSARIGVMPRYGDADSIRWFEVATCNVFHIFNCFEEDDEVVVRGCQARGSIIPGPDLGQNKFEWFSKGFMHINLTEKNDEDSQAGSLFARAREWRLNMQTGEVKEKNLTGTDFSIDFPVINENFVGLKNKYGYAHVVDSIASSDAGNAKYGGLAKLYFDEQEVESVSTENGQLEQMVKIEYHMFPKNTFCSGAAFVPKAGSLEEDDGWIISFMHDEDTNKSEAYIVDAKKFSSEPVAIITLPSRVPYGFHGVFASMSFNN